MNSMLARPTVGAGDFDIDIEDAQDSLDAFAMGADVSRTAPGNAAMTRTTSDSSGMISDVSNGNPPTGADQQERGRGRSASNDAGGETRSNLPRMVRRRPINRSDLLVRPPRLPHFRPS